MSDQPFGDDDWFRVTTNALDTFRKRVEPVLRTADMRPPYSLTRLQKESIERAEDHYSRTVLGFWDRYERETLIPRGDVYVLPSEVERLRAKTKAAP